MKIRTINEAYLELQSIDSSCSLTKYGIRQLVLKGEIPSFRRGNRYLIDLDYLLKHLNLEEVPERIISKDVSSKKNCTEFEVKAYRSRFTNT